VLENVGASLLLLVGIVLFVRLLSVGLRTREPTTLVIAGSVVVSVVGAALMVLAAGSAGEDLRLSDRLATGAVACATMVVTLQVVLIGLLFRPQSRTGWMASVGLIAAMWLTVLGTSFEGGIDLQRIPTGWRLANAVLLLGVLFWGSLEAAITWRFLRRQVRVGLADAKEARRIGLWSLASGASALGGVVGFATISFGVRVAETGIGLALAPLGLLAAAALWRAFESPGRLEVGVGPDEGVRAKPAMRRNHHALTDRQES
jgi:hypothetical protein